MKVPQYHWGFIDTTGQILIKAEYDAVSQFSENKAAINKDGLWGYMLHSGSLSLNLNSGLHIIFMKIVPVSNLSIFLNIISPPEVKSFLQMNGQRPMIFRMEEPRLKSALSMDILIPQEI